MIVPLDVYIYIYMYLIPRPQSNNHTINIIVFMNNNDKYIYRCIDRFEWFHIYIYTNTHTLVVCIFGWSLLLWCWLPVSRYHERTHNPRSTKP